MLTAGSSLSMKEAINVAALYGQYNTPQLRELSTPKLEVLRFSPDERKNIMAALKYAGHVELPKATPEHIFAAGALNCPLGNAKKSVKGKRAPRDAEPDLSAPTEVAAEYQPMPILDLHLDEITDEEAIKKEVVVCNRAPVMKAWAMVVCECLGFKRAEALSISAAYTEMNAISKGVSVGVMNKARGEHIELEQDDAQPYVDLMGRRIALMKSRDGTYRALVKGEPVDPTHAHSYIKRAFKQSSPRVFGAMRMLASSFAPNDLNTAAMGCMLVTF
ncbi:hypothetical protein BKA62DRAFT_826817 [Auriculariales sp. MPI-PUGE-AT-0066]|nr:hypothetical protein BKA62DRAFT_826817 [Auriculariales sp. MPI-PUGE-AT-0066]